MADIMKLAEKEFRAAIIITFKNVKENMSPVSEQMVAQ